MNNGKVTRTCGNCCFCKSDSVYSTVGTCVLTGKLTAKGFIANNKCDKHLFKKEKKGE